MGSFHIACTLLAVIGQRFGDAGLRDLMVESSLVGPSTVNAVLHGEHYNRAVRCLKIIFESLFRLLWPLFEEWLEQRNDCASKGDANKTALLDALSKVRTEKSAETFSNVTDLTSVDDLQGSFIDFLQKQKSPFARLWLSHMEMVSLFLQFIHAT